MKNKILASVMLLMMVILVTSCATSRSNRKYGCPMATVEVKSPNI